MIDKSILLKTIMLIFTSVIVIGNTASAKNADFTKTKTTINYSENNEGLYFDNENKLSFYQCVDDGRDEQHGYYMNLYKYRCDNGAIEKLQTIPIYEGDVRYAEEIGDAGDTIVVRTLKNRFVDFTVIDKDGKEVSNIVDKISYKKSDALSITDIYIKGKKLYYTYIINRSKVHIRCVYLKNGKFIFESGAPPDYFNSDGQKWGSPVYNVQNIKKDNYKYLVKRFKYYLKLFDKVRVDYFRGYDSFYKIPIGKSGREGSYSDGVSYGFFDELFKDETIKVEDLIIEDLGDIREETVKLREHYGFTRQKIFQFSIDLDNFYDRDNEEENILVFPGNHDCPTIHGWYKTLNDEYKEKLKEFLRRNQCCDTNVNRGVMQYCSKCKARIAIMTVQDILGLDDTARINIPGVKMDKNWSWKLKDFNEFRERIKDFE